MLGFKVIHEAMTFVTAQSVAQFLCYRDSPGEGCGAVCLSAALLIIPEALSSRPPKKTEQYTGISPCHGSPGAWRAAFREGLDFKSVVVKRNNSAACQQCGLCTPRTESLSLVLTAPTIPEVEATLWQVTGCFPVPLCRGVYHSGWESDPASLPR